MRRRPVQHSGLVIDRARCQGGEGNMWRASPPDHRTPMARTAADSRSAARDSPPQDSGEQPIEVISSAVKVAAAWVLAQKGTARGAPSKAGCGRVQMLSWQMPKTLATPACGAAAEMRTATESVPPALVSQGPSGPAAMGTVQSSTVRPASTGASSRPRR